MRSVTITMCLVSQMMSGSLQRTNISRSVPGIPTGAPADERDRGEAMHSASSVHATWHPTQPQTRIPHAGLPANYLGVLVQGIEHNIHAGGQMQSKPEPQAVKG